MTPQRSLAALTLALACAAPPSPEEPPRAAAPEPTSPGAARYAAAAAYSASRAGHVLLVLEEDEVVLEAGQNGHAADAPHPLFRGTESFWGVLAVAADADGLLDLDEPVSFTLPEFEASPWKRAMRVRQLLNFTSGLPPGYLALRREQPPDWFERALALEPVSQPGERFQYGDAHLFVFGELLRRKLRDRGEDPVEYLERRLLEPIGLRIDAWERDAAGNPDLPSGATLAAREWAKFGRLVGDRGRWEGRTVVEPEALAACFEGSPAFRGYGLGFWLNAASLAGSERGRGPAEGASFYAERLPDLVVAAGLGNQRLYVAPSHGLVAVRFGAPDRRWRDREFLALLEEAALGRPGGIAGQDGGSGPAAAGPDPGI